MIATQYFFVLTNQPIGLGRGGNVFKGKRRVLSENNHALPAEVAVKRIDKWYEDPSVFSEVQNEIEILAELSAVSDPNIVKCVSVHNDDRYYYVFYEYFSGGHLLQRIRTMEKFTENEARHLCLRLLSIVQSIHSLGIVHRDLKPENIMFENASENAEIKLIDFGFATFVDENDCCHPEVLGTEFYMAPEIWRREPYGRPVDMWAIGVIAYLMLSGQQPFPCRNISELANNNELIVSFESDVWRNISQNGKEFVSALLCQNPANRLTSSNAPDHEWFAVNTEDLAVPLVDAKANLQSFQSWNKLRILIKATKKFIRNYKKRKMEGALRSSVQRLPSVREDGTDSNVGTVGAYAQQARESFEQLVEDIKRSSSDPIVDPNTPDDTQTDSPQSFMMRRLSSSRRLSPYSMLIGEGGSSTAVRNLSSLGSPVPATPLGPMLTRQVSIGNQGRVYRSISAPGEESGGLYRTGSKAQSVLPLISSAKTIHARFDSVVPRADSSAAVEPIASPSAAEAAVLQLEMANAELEESISKSLELIRQYKSAIAKNKKAINELKSLN